MNQVFQKTLDRIRMEFSVKLKKIYGSVASSGLKIYLQVDIAYLASKNYLREG